MKICVEAKSEKRFDKLVKKYCKKKYNAWMEYDGDGCVEITKGAHQSKKWLINEGYKILTYKQWKAVMKPSDNSKVAIKCKTLEQYKEAKETYGRVDDLWFYKGCNYVIAERNHLGSKEWCKEEGYLILSYKEWKAIRGEKNESI